MLPSSLWLLCLVAIGARAQNDESSSISSSVSSTSADSSSSSSDSSSSSSSSATPVFFSFTNAGSTITGSLIPTSIPTGSDITYGYLQSNDEQYPWNFMFRNVACEGCHTLLAIYKVHTLYLIYSSAHYPNPNPTRIRKGEHQTKDHRERTKAPMVHPSKTRNHPSETPSCINNT
jgi:hypothetical protein